MIIFLNEDGAYRSWILHHRAGYVLDGRWRSRLTQLKLHRARCQAVQIARRKATHATTGGRFKACCATLEELRAWAEANSGSPPQICPACEPTKVQPAEAIDGSHHLSLLSARMLDYVLEVAVVHLENPASPFRLPLTEVAACLGKTVGQLTETTQNLVNEGLIVEIPIRRGRRSAVDRLILPTAAALRTLPFFRNLSTQQLSAEMERLKPTPG